METLYISDVDGTLTREGNTLSDETVRLLTQVLQNGTALTLATGRSLNGIYDITTRCGIQYPVIALNGAMIYDLANNRAVKLFPIPRRAAEELCRIYEDAGIRFTANIYIQKEERSKAYFNYDKRYPWPMRAVNRENGLYHDERCRVERVSAHLEEGECLYFGSSGTQEQIAAVREEMKKVPGVKGYFHQSPYEAGKWFLDVVGEGSGKGAAALYLKEYLGAGELVTFGDNHNDIPMLAAADRSYTVPEAPPEVQRAATAVLDDDPNCVAQFLLGCRD